MSALPSPTPSPANGPTTRDIIRDELSRSTSPDPNAVVHVVLARLTTPQINDVIEHGIRTVVGKVMRAERTKAMTKPSPLPKRERDPGVALPG